MATPYINAYPLAYKQIRLTEFQARGLDNGSIFEGPDPVRRSSTMQCKNFNRVGTRGKAIDIAKHAHQNMHFTTQNRHLLLAIEGSDSTVDRARIVRQGIVLRVMVNRLR